MAPTSSATNPGQSALTRRTRAAHNCSHDRGSYPPSGNDRGASPGRPTRRGHALACGPAPSGHRGAERRPSTDRVQRTAGIRRRYESRRGRPTGMSPVIALIAASMAVASRTKRSRSSCSSSRARRPSHEPDGAPALPCHFAVLAIHPRIGLLGSLSVRARLRGDKPRESSIARGSPSCRGYGDRTSGLDTLLIEAVRGLNARSWLGGGSGAGARCRDPMTRARRARRQAWPS